MAKTSRYLGMIGMGFVYAAVLFGTATAQPALVADLNPSSIGSDPRAFTPYAGALYFLADHDGVGLYELWRYDGVSTTRVPGGEMLQIAPRIREPGLIVYDGALTDFDANGWWSTSDLTTTNTVAPCIAIMQVQNGEYVRVFPEAPGTLDCEAGVAVEVSLDPAEF